jgi:hypothetical protein
VNKEQAIDVIEHLRGSKLSPLQAMILREAWDDQLYEYSAEISQHECQYVKKVGARLWREVSELTGAWVNKRNFRPVIQRYYYNQLPSATRCRLLSQSWHPSLKSVLVFPEQRQHIR